MYRIIDGKAHSAKLRAEIKLRAEKYFERTGRRVGLAVVLVGNDPASQVYVRNKIKACEEAGIKSFANYLPEDATQSQVEEVVSGLVRDESINGILVQLPLPAQLDEKRILDLIPVEKDVDGFSEQNIGRLCLNQESLVACTPNVVIGRSNIVGKPMAMLLLNSDATVTVCHSKTQNLKDICSRADILVAAIGRAKFVTAGMVKQGAVVVDVGINRNEDGKLCGDVDFENVKDKCSYITPVPGGVGPMTITMLLYNTVCAAERS